MKGRESRAAAREGGHGGKVAYTGPSSLQTEACVDAVTVRVDLTLCSKPYKVAALTTKYRRDHSVGLVSTQA